MRLLSPEEFASFHQEPSGRRRKSASHRVSSGEAFPPLVPAPRAWPILNQPVRDHLLRNLEFAKKPRKNRVPVASAPSDEPESETPRMLAAPSTEIKPESSTFQSRDRLRKTRIVFKKLLESARAEHGHLPLSQTQFPEPPNLVRVCYHCGAKRTPMWRHGPREFIILCTACGR